MKTTYEKYKNEVIWDTINKAISALEENQDLKLTTLEDYIVGYIVKELSENFTFSKK